MLPVTARKGEHWSYWLKFKPLPFQSTPHNTRLYSLWNKVSLSITIPISALRRKAATHARLLPYNIHKDSGMKIPKHRTTAAKLHDSPRLWKCEFKNANHYMWWTVHHNSSFTLLFGYFFKKSLLKGWMGAT